MSKQQPQTRETQPREEIIRLVWDQSLDLHLHIWKSGTLKFQLQSFPYSWCPPHLNGLSIWLSRRNRDVLATVLVPVPGKRRDNRGARIYGTYCRALAKVCLGFKPTLLKSLFHLTRPCHSSLQQYHEWTWGKTQLLSRTVLVLHLPLHWPSCRRSCWLLLNHTIDGESTAVWQHLCFPCAAPTCFAFALLNYFWHTPVDIFLEMDVS